MIKAVTIWLPPALDHKAWQEFIGSRWSRLQFETAVRKSAKESEEQGLKVEIVSISVSKVMELLDKKSLENSPDNRAKAVAEWYDEQAD